MDKKIKTPIVFTEINTCSEFNEIFKEHLEHRHYGMSINDKKVLKYLAEEFKKEKELNEEIEYAQIKLKFNYVCVYTNANSNKNSNWEKEINLILKD
jgi:hypothetical protein